MGPNTNTYIDPSLYNRPTPSHGVQPDPNVPAWARNMQGSNNFDLNFGSRRPAMASNTPPATIDPRLLFTPGPAYPAQPSSGSRSEADRWTTYHDNRGRPAQPPVNPSYNLQPQPGQGQGPGRGQPSQPGASQHQPGNTHPNAPRGSGRGRGGRGGRSGPPYHPNDPNNPNNRRPSGRGSGSGGYGGDGQDDQLPLRPEVLAELVRELLRMEDEDEVDWELV